MAFETLTTVEWSNGGPFLSIPLGSVLNVGPATLRLTFTGPVDAATSLVGVEVTGVNQTAPNVIEYTAVVTGQEILVDIIEDGTIVSAGLMPVVNSDGVRTKVFDFDVRPGGDQGSYSGIGSLVTDLEGGTTGTFGPGVTTTPLGPGLGYEFDFNNDSIDWGDVAPLRDLHFGGRAFGIMFRADSMGSSGFPRVFAAMNDVFPNATNGWSLYLREQVGGACKIAIQEARPDGTPTNRRSSGEPVVFGQDTFVVVVFGTSGASVPQVYVNGVLQVMGLVSSGSPAIDQTDVGVPKTLGDAAGALSRPFDGQIDKLVVFGEELDQTQVTILDTVIRQQGGTGACDIDYFTAQAIGGEGPVIFEFKEDIAAGNGFPVSALLPSPFTLRIPIGEDWFTLGSTITGLTSSGPITKGPAPEFAMLVPNCVWDGVSAVSVNVNTQTGNTCSRTLLEGGGGGGPCTLTIAGVEWEPGQAGGYVALGGPLTSGMVAGNTPFNLRITYSGPPSLFDVLISGVSGPTDSVSVLGNVLTIEGVQWDGTGPDLEVSAEGPACLNTFGDGDGGGGGPCANTLLSANYQGPSGPPVIFTPPMEYSDVSGFASFTLTLNYLSDVMPIAVAIQGATSDPPAVLGSTVVFTNVLWDGTSDLEVTVEGPSCFQVIGNAAGGGGTPGCVRGPNAPRIENVSPNQLASVPPEQVISLDIVDDDGDLSKVFIFALFQDTGIQEVVYTPTDASIDTPEAGFAPRYIANSTATPITNGMRYTFERTGGWPSPPKLRIFAFDETFNEL